MASELSDSHRICPRIQVKFHYDYARASLRSQILTRSPALTRHWQIASSDPPRTHLTHTHTALNLSLRQSVKSLLTLSLYARCHPHPTEARISKSPFFPNILLLLPPSTPPSPGTIQYHKVLRSLIHEQPSPTVVPLRSPLHSKNTAPISLGPHAATRLIAAEIACTTHAYECHMNSQKLLLLLHGASPICWRGPPGSTPPSDHAQKHTRMRFTFTKVPRTLSSVPTNPMCVLLIRSTYPRRRNGTLLSSASRPWWVTYGNARAMYSALSFRRPLMQLTPTAQHGVRQTRKANLDYAQAAVQNIHILVSANRGNSSPGPIASRRS